MCIKFVKIPEIIDYDDVSRISSILLKGAEFNICMVETNANNKTINEAADFNGRIVKKVGRKKYLFVVNDDVH